MIKLQVLVLHKQDLDSFALDRRWKNAVGLMHFETSSDSPYTNRSKLGYQCACRSLNIHNDINDDQTFHLSNLWFCHETETSVICFSQKDPGLWCFVCCYPRQAVEKPVELLMTWDALLFIYHPNAQIRQHLSNWLTSWWDFVSSLTLI